MAALVDVQDDLGRIELHKVENTEAAETLLDAGSNINHQDAQGLTPLHNATYHNNGKLVTLLLQRGANPNLKSKNQETPLDFAIDSHHLELVRLLLTGKIKQHLHKIYPLENAAAALQDLQDQKVIGKAIIKIGNWEENLVDLNTTRANETESLKKEISINPIHFSDKSELIKNIGRDLGKTEWLTINQERITQFAESTLDFQWVHLDSEKAKTDLPGGKTIAHGYLTMSLVSNFFYQLISIGKVNSFINYGINKARFISPVEVGSEIRMSAYINNVEEMPNGSVKLYLNCTIEIKGHNKPAFVAEIISMIF